MVERGRRFSPSKWCKFLKTCRPGPPPEGRIFRRGLRVQGRRTGRKSPWRLHRSRQRGVDRDTEEPLGLPAASRVTHAGRPKIALAERRLTGQKPAQLMGLADQDTERRFRRYFLLQFETRIAQPFTVFGSRTLRPAEAASTCRSAHLPHIDSGESVITPSTSASRPSGPTTFRMLPRIAVTWASGKS